MFTVCPKCALTLTVTAADLRVAQGYVRCGQCTNVFNALLTLSDERPAAAPAAPSAEAAQSQPAAQPESQAPPAPSAGPDAGAGLDEGSPLEDEDAIEQTSLEFNPDAADVAKIFVEPDAITDDAVTGTYESIVLGTPESSAAGIEEAPPERSADEQLNDELESLAARIVAARQNEVAQTHTELQPLIEVPAPGGEPAAQARPHLWSAALAGLLLLLLLQAVNHYREELAVSPRWHGGLSAIYAALGIALVPHWDLSAYEVHQLGASAPAQSSGELTVRASVKNDAAQAQPLPLLRVTLLDRFGNRLAERDVTPQAYLGRAPGPDTLLSAGERVDAQMAFVDPGRDAVGFEIDACLPAPSARVHCANDGSAR